MLPPCVLCRDTFTKKNDREILADLPLVFMAINCNFDTNALFVVMGKVILEGVMHHILPINPDLKL